MFALSCQGINFHFIENENKDSLADNIKKIKALEYDDGVVQGQGHRKVELTGDRCLIGHAANPSAVRYNRVIFPPPPSVLINPRPYDHV